MPPQNKGKGKQNKVPIDFSQPIASLAHNDPDAESWFEEGLRQEAQGERYQSGPKSLRDYENASTSYRVATSLQPSFKSHYNAARVDQIRAEEAPAPLCTELLHHATVSLRDALELHRATPTSSRLGADEMDGLFNLASAIASMGEMIEDGARDGLENEGDPAVLYTEAHELFCQVEGLQLREMERVGVSSKKRTRTSRESSLSGEEEGGGEDKVAVESVTVVPTAVLDTILEEITNELRLYMLTFSAKPAKISQSAAIAGNLSLALERLASIRKLIPASQDNAEQDLQCELAYLDIVHACSSTIGSTSVYSDSSTDITTNYRKLLQSHPNNLDLLSQFADHLLETVDRGAVDRSNVIIVLREALSSYSKAQSILSDRLRRPASVPAHTVPSLLCSNLVSQTAAHLAIYHSLLETSSSATNTSELDQALNATHNLALSAINASNAGVRITTPDGSNIVTSPVARTDASNPQLEWRTVKAFRDAFFTLIRVRMRMGVEGPGLGLYQKVTGREGKSDVRRWVDDIEGDFVWEVTKGAEESRWMSLLS